MTAVEQRIVEMLDRWLASLDQHLAYAMLDDAAYWKARQWVPHERPAVWIIEVARQRTLQLKALFEARQNLSADQVAEALEHAVFLANLVGSQNVQRFIPLIGSAAESDDAGPAPPTPAAPSSSSAEPPPSASDTQRFKSPLGAAAAGRPSPPAPRRAPPSTNAAHRSTAETSTREMPRPAVPSATPQEEPRRQGHHAHARSAARVVPRQEPGRKSPTESARSTPRSAPSKPEQGVMADAVRLVKWGRDWHELAEAIARMSGRPPLEEVRQILKQRRAEIEGEVASSTDS